MWRTMPERKGLGLGEDAAAHVEMCAWLSAAEVMDNVLLVSCGLRTLWFSRLPVVI